MLGHYRGTIDSAGFSKVARALIDGGFYSLDTVYEEAITDFPTVFVCVRTAGVDRCIRQYGRIYPRNFLRLVATIDSATPRITWHPASPQ